MGLLDGAMGAQAPQMGGLLGGFGGGAPAAQDGGNGLKMIQQLDQNPTPQMAHQLAEQLMQKGPEGQKMAELLTQLADNPDGLRGFANTIMQHLSGGAA